MRSPESILHEADYWTLITDDIVAINNEVAEIHKNLTRIGTTSITANLNKNDEALAWIGGLAIGAMIRIHSIQDHLLQIMDLANGRAIALNAEADEVTNA